MMSSYFTRYDVIMNWFLHTTLFTSAKLYSMVRVSYGELPGLIQFHYGKRSWSSYYTHCLNLQVEPEWLRSLERYHVVHTQSQSRIRVTLMLEKVCMDQTGSAAMLAIKRLAGVAPVRVWFSGIHCACMWPSRLARDPQWFWNPGIHLDKS